MSDRTNPDTPEARLLAAIFGRDKPEAEADDKPQATTNNDDTPPCKPNS